MLFWLQIKLQELKKHEGFAFEINRKLLELLLRVITRKPRGAHTCVQAQLQGGRGAGFAEVVSPASSSAAAASGSSQQQQAVGSPPAGRDEQPAQLDGDMYVCEACQLLVRLYEQLVALLELVVPREQLALPDSQLPPIDPLVNLLSGFIIMLFLFSFCFHFLSVFLLCSTGVRTRSPITWIRRRNGLDRRGAVSRISSSILLNI